MSETLSEVEGEAEGLPREAPATCASKELSVQRLFKLPCACVTAAENAG